MLLLSRRGQWRKEGTCMKRAIVLCGSASFVMAFLGGMLAFHLAGPPGAAAQSDQLEELRASAFVVVAPDGTVLGRLGPGAAGNGGLSLSDTAGRQRWNIGAGGALSVYDLDGTIRFRAGYQPELGPGGAALVNGVLLGPGGSVSALPTLP
jgi:hypothetical protein